MYQDLPNHLKEEVKCLLTHNQFPTAKALHDAWMQDQLWHLSTD